MNLFDFGPVLFAHATQLVRSKGGCYCSLIHAHHSHLFIPLKYHNFLQQNQNPSNLNVSTSKFMIWWYWCCVSLFVDYQLLWSSCEFTVLRLDRSALLHFSSNWVEEDISMLWFRDSFLFVSFYVLLYLWIRVLFSLAFFLVFYLSVTMSAMIWN